MTLPSSGQISLNNVQSEFGGSNPIGMNEYYRGGSYVGNFASNNNIPTSGTISLNNFYGGSSFGLSGGNIANGIAPGNGYVYHTFSSPGTLTVYGSGSVEYLVVAGGGNGYSSWTGDAGGAGGAGGVRQGTTPIGPGSYSVTVGGANNPSNLAFPAPVGCTRGGPGGSTTGVPGGSGGGGTGYNASRGGGGGTAGQGNSGGTGAHQGTGGGGGGKSGGGGVGPGGSGAQYPQFYGPLIGIPSIAPYNSYFGGGGGGHGRWGPPAPGGAGGGGNPGNKNGVNYLGGGGAGGNNNYYGAGGGGSGLVVVRYAI